MRERFLPTTAEDAKQLGWDQVDLVWVSGDAYVDHPSFGHAILTRVLQARGYRVAVLAQPSWKDAKDFMRFGKPRLGFFVSSGVVDSMVSHYTVAKKRRGEDAYSPGGKIGLRPDRASIVYANGIRKAYGDVPIVIGGLEASLRRFAHYDYWEDRVRRSILVDSGADILSFGMGERSVPAIADALAGGTPVRKITDIPGTCYLSKNAVGMEIFSCEEVIADKMKYAKAFAVQYEEMDAVRGKVLCQKHGASYVVQNVPDMPLARNELDRVHALPYVRAWHPDYDAAGGVPAIEEVKFSVAATRGCFGACNFCALSFHQGRMVSSRSHRSVVEEVKQMTHDPDFKGYVHDVGGPTANFRRPSCDLQVKNGVCARKKCMAPKPCTHLVVEHDEFIALLRELRALPKIKKVFIRSGLRYDYMLQEKNDAFLDELVQHHISGQLKVAPEHVSDKVLGAMGKPSSAVYDTFMKKYAASNKKYGKKQFLVPYFMSSHPGCDLPSAIQLAQYLKKTGQRPEQVQDFYPTPGTLSTAMYYTGLDPFTLEPVHVPKDREKAMQRALLQCSRPQNHALARAALTLCHREELIGFGKDCLVRPATPLRNTRTEMKHAKPKAKSNVKMNPKQVTGGNKHGAEIQKGKRDKNASRNERGKSIPRTHKGRR